MEIWLYGNYAALLVCALGLCYIANCWIGICSSCQIRRYIPDFYGNHPTRLQAITVSEPFRVLTRDTRVLSSDRHVPSQPSSKTPSLRPLPSVEGDILYEHPSPSIYGPESEIKNSTSNSEVFLCKIDIEEQKAIYTIVNDTDSELTPPASTRCNRQNNYSSFVPF